MAATTTTNINLKSKNEVTKQEIQAAIAKAVELRAIHAALMQGGSPPHHPKPFSSASSSSPPPPPPQLSAHDYPVFTPSYEDEPLPGFRQLQLESRALSEAWGDQYGSVGDNGSGIVQSDFMTENGSSRKHLPLVLASLESHSQACAAADHDTRSVTSSCTNQITVLQTSPAAELLKSRRTSLGDPKSVSSCNKCSNQHGFNDADSIASGSTNCKQSSAADVPRPKSKAMSFSWLLPRSKKKPKSEPAPVGVDSEEAFQILKKDLLDANQKRDVALAEVSEMRSSFGDLRKKLESLEGYCEELKRAWRQAVQANGSQNMIQEQGHDKVGSVSKRGSKSGVCDREDDLMPVSEEVMVEGFLQVVSEARLSVKHFCKTLVRQIEETDDQLIDNVNSLLRPHKLSLSSKYSKAVLYHLEAIVNQALYQDFENCSFQKNGSPKLLDPQQNRQAQFSSFVALRNLSWNEVIREGTKHYSEEFSAFCDQKMSCIISGLNWIRPWPEQLLQSFFVAAKCIRLLHLLAFSFNPPLTILRVEENRPFDPHYMEDIPIDRQRTQKGPSRVKIMVMPGFYVQDKILKCKVLCRYKSEA